MNALYQKASSQLTKSISLSQKNKLNNPNLSQNNNNQNQNEQDEPRNPCRGQQQQQQENINNNSNNQNSGSIHNNRNSANQHLNGQLQKINSHYRGLNISQTPKNTINSNQFYFGKGYSNTPNETKGKQKLFQKQNNTNKLTDSIQYNQNNNNNDDNKSELQEEMLAPSQIPQIDPSRTSNKNLGLIACYGANTHQGTVRNYNEDRVSIILNMMKPKNKQNEQYWPTCSFFGIYDGHGGQNCAEFLRDQLHYYIIQDEYFPKDPYKAIKRGFEKAEEEWTIKADSQPVFDKSGSCAIVVMLVDNVCYAANLGDSRAILSEKGGNVVVDLSTDHKPQEPTEQQRITSLGGQIYQSQIPMVVNNKTGKQQIIKGPFRVMPGRLAVSRTIGDSEAKLPKYGGIKNVISAEPDVIKFEIQDDHDFIFLGCDGIFDKMTNKEVISNIWDISPQHKNPHDFIGKSIERIMQLSMMKKSFDNVTCVIVGFKNLENGLNQQLKNLINKSNKNNS